MNNKGGATTYFFVALLLFVGVVIGTLVLYTVSIFMTSIAGVEFDNSTYVGESLDLSIGTTTGFFLGGITTVRYIALFVFFGAMLFTLISVFLVRAHPVFFFPYVLVILLLTVVAIFTSNMYEKIVTSSALLEAEYSKNIGIHYILLNLPQFLVAVAFIAGILMFIGFPQSPDESGTVGTTGGAFG